MMTHRVQFTAIFFAIIYLSDLLSIQLFLFHFFYFILLSIQLFLFLF